MEINYNELKKKEVVDILNGKNLGKISDLIIDSECGKILKILKISLDKFKLRVYHISKII